MPRHDGFVAMLLPSGKLAVETFARLRGDANRRSLKAGLRKGQYKLIRVRLTPSDPPYRGG